MKIFTRKLLFFSFVITAIGAVSPLFSAAQLIKAAQAKQAPVKTGQNALAVVAKIITNYPEDLVAAQMYEKQQTDLLVKCAKLLYDNTRTQILDALLEIDNRIAYWQYQKDHPWNYFVSKSPVKWVTGPKQEDEIETNLDLLQSQQGELYVLLGQLSELGNVFVQGYKDLFLTDYTKGYEWIDNVLNALSRIKTSTSIQQEGSVFITRARLLHSKLENVNRFKDDILAEISETAIPGYVARNWLKGGALLFGLGYGYNNFYDQLTSSVVTTQQNLQENVINPVTATVKDVLFPGWQKGGEQEEIIPGALKSYKSKLELTKEYVTKMGDKYGLQEEAKDVLKDLEANKSKIELTKEYVTKMDDKYELQEKAKDVLEDLETKDLSKYEKFLEDVANKESLVLSYWPSDTARSTEKWVENLKDYGRGQLLGTKLEAAQSLYAGAQYALSQKQQYDAVGRVVLLIPAAIAGGIGYAAYQKLTAKNYSPLRRALVDINSLFVDPSQPLSDEQYGKMVYLIYNVKKQAEKILPRKNNIQADFIHDLERIESKEFNVASKRAIVEDMFKKYDFLGLVQKK